MGLVGKKCESMFKCSPGQSVADTAFPSPRNQFYVYAIFVSVEGAGMGDGGRSSPIKIISLIWVVQDDLKSSGSLWWRWGQILAGSTIISWRVP